MAGQLQQPPAREDDGGWGEPVQTTDWGDEPGGWALGPATVLRGLGTMLSRVSPCVLTVGRVTV